MEGGEWSNFNAAVCVNEEADFMAQLFLNNSNEVNVNYGRNYNHNHNHNGRKNSNGEGGQPCYYSSDSNSNSHQNAYFYTNSQENDHDHHHHQVHYHNYFSDNNNDNQHHHHPIDFLNCQMEDENNNVDLNEDLEAPLEGKSVGISKKKPRALEVPKVGKRNVRMKRSQSSLTLGRENEEENGTPVHHRRSSSSGSLDDDCSSKGTSITTTTTTTTALNSSGKTRASRGSASDPQSLYARKRRERINERLRILQSLVPNGTKVDISTMLEEAVHYVKFLQHQIKLLSSDDLWMYAPIAYNGMNIGLGFQYNMMQR